MQITCQGLINEQVDKTAHRMCSQKLHSLFDVDISITTCLEVHASIFEIDAKIGNGTGV